MALTLLSASCGGADAPNAGVGCGTLPDEVCHARAEAFWTAAEAVGVSRDRFFAEAKDRVHDVLWEEWLRIAHGILRNDVDVAKDWPYCISRLAAMTHDRSTTSTSIMPPLRFAAPEPRVEQVPHGVAEHVEAVNDSS